MVNRVWRLAAGLVLSAGAALPAADFFVAASGNNANPGTLQSPFATIQRGADAAQAGDTVYIRAGVYRESVRVPRSGTAAARIRFSAYQNEAVTISGADAVNTAWTTHSGTGASTIYKTTLTPNTAEKRYSDLGFGRNQVFVDGQMVIDARWPNTGLDLTHPAKATMINAPAVTYNNVGSNPDGYNSTCSFSDPALDGFWSGGIIHINPGKGWFAQTGKITASSDGALTFQFRDYNTSMRPVKNCKYYLTGKLEALDAPGEWFRGGNTLYLRTPGSDNPAGHTIEIKGRDYAFDLRGTDYITVEKLKIFATTIICDQSTSNALLDQLDAKYVTHYLLHPSGSTRINDSGILLNGTNNVLQRSTIAWSCGNGVWMKGDGNRIDHCVVHDCNYNGYREGCITTRGNHDGNGGHSDSRNCQITNCTLYNSGREIIKHDKSANLKIKNNEMYQGGLQTSDCGATYTFGADGENTEIAYNVVHDMDGTHGVSAHGGVGIYLDHLNRNFIIHHNAVYNCYVGIQLNYGTTTYRNNFKVYNNTTWNTAFSMVGDHGNDTTALYDCVYKNNLWNKEIDNRVKPNAVTKTGATNTNIVYESCRIAPATDFTAAENFDFTLRAKNPVAAPIDAGQIIAPYTDGYVGAAPDQGAYEFGRTSWQAGALRSLAVQNGSGSGSYRVNSTVAITANAAPAGQVFDRWSCLISGVIADVLAPATTVEMPASGANVKVTATYRASVTTTPFRVTIQSVSTGKAYNTAIARTGVLYYIDRSYTITSLSANLNNGVLIRQANDDKYGTAAAHLTFSVNADATVYVCYDKRAAVLPSWLDASWAPVTDAFNTTDTAACPMKVFAKNVGVGSVTLGGNLTGARGALTNYVVIVKPGVQSRGVEASVGPAESDPALLAAPVWAHDGDSDGDGLLDGYELAIGYALDRVDTVGNGTTDEDELISGGAMTHFEAQQLWLRGELPNQPDNNPATPKVPMTVTKFGAALNFSGGAESFSLSAILPQHDALRDLAGKTISLEIDGVHFSVQLDRKGSGKAGGGQLKLQSRKGSTTLKASFKGALSETWTAHGLVGPQMNSGAKITLKTILNINGTLFTQEVHAKFSSRGSKATLKK